ncbi:hypothetical protein XpopCFBP1817_20870, partial [Xanthomonas populi]
RLPCDPRSLTRWRQRLGENGRLAGAPPQRCARRQRTLLGRVLRDMQRDMQRKLDQVETSVRERIAVCLERAQRRYTQRPKDTQKLYALHAPEVACIGNGKARQPYEFGVKVGIAVSACKG